MAGIFICYRREDSGANAGRINDWIRQELGEEAVFFDVDSIQPGDDFIAAIERRVSDCDVLLAVIGKDWLSGRDRDGLRRIDNPEDFVHAELATALRRNVRIIPVLVEGATMPRRSELPDVLGDLVRRHAFELSHNRFRDEIGRLLQILANAVPAEKSGTRRIHPPAAGTCRVHPLDGLTYVYIAPGRFTMGASPGDTECRDSERPAHEVQITRGFWIGQTPVTQAAYAKVMKGANPSHFKGAEQPVENVSWEDASAYCKAVGMRLPTEAEWEYAARAGNGNARYGPLDGIAWYGANSGGETHPAGRKEANAWGLHDTLGNVWEWVSDRYGAYERQAVSDPVGPPNGGSRVLRGGSWGFNPEYVRVSNRVRSEASNRYSDIGFRCAGELP